MFAGNTFSLVFSMAIHSIYENTVVLCSNGSWVEKLIHLSCYLLNDLGIKKIESIIDAEFTFRDQQLHCWLERTGQTAMNRRGLTRSYTHLTKQCHRCAGTGADTTESTREVAGVVGCEDAHLSFPQIDLTHYQSIPESSSRSGRRTNHEGERG